MTTTQIRSVEPALGEAGPNQRRWRILRVLCLSVFVIVIDGTIVNVALPTMVRELGATTSQLQWIVDAYTLVFAGLLLAAGSLGDRYGRKAALAIGLACSAQSPCWPRLAQPSSSSPPGRPWASARR